MLAAFPLAYSLILSALYLPLVLMLTGLIWRGVAFEFRFKADEHHRPFWDRAFTCGSYVATFFQGVALGAFIDGIPAGNGLHSGGLLDWLTPFSLFSGIGLLVAYGLLGGTWLIMKTEGPLQDRMFALTRTITLALLAIIAVVSLWTPLAHPTVAERWFSLPNLLFLAPVPVLVVLTGTAMMAALRRRCHAMPFSLALFLLFLGYSGLAISLWPNIVPPALSIREAAAPPQSMGFTLVGALLIIPVILSYTGWSYYVFRGKVRAGEGYH